MTPALLVSWSSYWHQEWVVSSMEVKQKGRASFPRPCPVGLVSQDHFDLFNFHSLMHHWILSFPNSTRQYLCLLLMTKLSLSHHSGIYSYNMDAYYVKSIFIKIMGTWAETRGSWYGGVCRLSSETVELHPPLLTRHPTFSVLGFFTCTRRIIMEATSQWTINKCTCRYHNYHTVSTW
jgi:hypothetical protein